MNRTAARAVARALSIGALAAWVLACGGGDGEGGSSGGRGASGRLSIMVDSYALAYFAERIGGNLVTVGFPAPAGVDPSFWTPDAETIALYQRADLILINGAGFAGWIDTATLPGSRVVDTTAAIADRLLPLEGAVTHSHGGLGEHSHAGFATRIWLDPTLAAAQADTIAAALAGARPESKAIFDDGLLALRRDLEALDARLGVVAGRIGETPLLFSHPVYAYLVHRYGLSARSLHWEPAEVPGHFGLAQLDDQRTDHPATLLIWEAPPVAGTLAELERRGIRSLVFEPLAERPAGGDYLSVMSESAARLEAAFPAP